MKFNPLKRLAELDAKGKAKAEEIQAKELARQLAEGFTISEKGRNGSATFTAKGLNRTLAKRIGKDDRQFIPYSQIQFVEHDRRLGSDTVIIHLTNNSLTWKIFTQGEGFVDLLNERIG